MAVLFNKVTGLLGKGCHNSKWGRCVLSHTPRPTHPSSLPAQHHMPGWGQARRLASGCKLEGQSWPLLAAPSCLRVCLQMPQLLGDALCRNKWLRAGSGAVSTLVGSDSQPCPAPPGAAGDEDRHKLEHAGTGVGVPVDRHALQSRGLGTWGGERATRPVDEKGATGEPQLARGRPAWQPHRLRDLKQPHGRL